MIKSKWMWVALTVLLLLVVWGIKGCANGVMEDYSEGTRVGSVTKLSYKGVFWKTWEGEMQLVGTEQADKGVVPNIFEFNISDEKSLVPIKAAMLTNQRIEITYKQWLIRPIWLGSGSVVQSVKLTEDR